MHFSEHWEEAGIPWRGSRNFPFNNIDNKIFNLMLGRTVKQKLQNLFQIEKLKKINQ